MCMLLGKGYVKRYRGNECIYNNRIIVARVVLYAVRVASKESLWVCLCILLPLIGKGGEELEFFMRFVLYERKVSNQFFPELLVIN
jgi:hypothetical protein